MLPAKRYDKFLELLATTGNISASAEGAGVSRSAVYDRLATDAAFRARVDEAKEESVDRLEAIARKRAEESSDTLMIFLLKALRPERYRERYQATLSTAVQDYIIDIGAE